MIDIKFIFMCCDNCKHRKIYIKENTLRSNGGMYDNITVIGCEHEEVCKEYKECKEKISTSCRQGMDK